MKLLKNIFFAPLIVVCTTLCMSTTYTAEPSEHKTEALLLEEMKKQQATDDALEKIIIKDLEALLFDPSNELDAYYNKGISCFSKREYTQAREFFEHIVETQNALKLNRDALIQAYRYLGRIHYHGHGTTKNKSQGLAYFNKLLEIDGIEISNFIAWLEAKVHTGTACYFNKQYQEAREHFESIHNVIKTRQLNVETINNIGWIDTYVLLAKIYFWGLGGNQDIVEAAKLFLVVAQSNFVQQNYPYMQLEALLYEGAIYYKKGLYGIATYYLTKITTIQRAEKINQNAYREARTLLKEIRETLSPQKIN